MPWAPDYCTLAQLKAYLRIPDTADDAQLSTVITAASRAVDDTCNRQFGNTALQQRTYQPHWSRARQEWRIDIDDVQDVTGLLVTDVGGVDPVEVDIYQLAPNNAAADGVPYTVIRVEDGLTGGDVEVTALWGWAAVPVAVVQATLQQASRLHSRRDSPYGVAGSPSGGSEMKLLARVDPDIATTLNPYRRARLVMG